MTGIGDTERRGDRWALAALFLGAAAIAFAPIFVRLSVLEPTATAFHRAFLSLPLLWLPWIVGQGRGRLAEGRLSGRDKALLMLAGAFFAGDLACWHWALRYTSVANSTLLANFAPFFVTLGAVVLFKERVTRQFLLGLALALCGAVVLIGDSLDLGGGQVLGDGLGLLTAVFYAAYILSVGRLRARFSVLTVMAWSTLGTAVVLLPIVLLSGEALVAPSAYGWAVLLGLAWFSHCGGQGLIAFALAHLPAPFSSVSLLLQPVIAALLAWALLAEPLGVWQAAGGSVVLAGIFLARRGSR